MKFHISCTNEEKLTNHCIARDWDDICSTLRVLKEGRGTFDIRLIDAPDPGPISMQLRAEKRKYLVTLLEASEDDTEVRDYTNPNAPHEMVEILGDRWDARFLVDDFDLVLTFFKEFFETGDVSRERLS